MTKTLMASKKEFTLKLLQSIEPQVADDLVAHIETLFNINCSLEYIYPDLEFAKTPERGQYSSTAILAFIKKKKLEKERALLAVVNDDIYAKGMNFVFGEAEVGGRVAVISLARLRPSYWGKPNSIEILKQRARKEATHELGHVMGLNHCSNTRCVMFFSNTLEDTDKKLDRFCPDCTHLLAEELIKL